jgi:chromosomal replication initiation ATPase DnaA
MAKQLVLELPIRPALGREDFILAPCNAEAVTRFDQWPDWEDPVQAIYGEVASGKSHLLAVWCQQSGAELVQAKDLDPDAAAASILPPNGLALDGIDELSPDAEVLLFHLINLARAEHRPLVMTSRKSVGYLSIGLPDLMSRLRGLGAIGLNNPDDTLLTRLLQKLLRDRQLELPVALLDYAISRSDRSCEAMAQLASALDAESLSEKRPITRPMIAKLLNLA